MTLGKIHCVEVQGLPHEIMVEADKEFLIVINGLAEREFIIYDERDTEEIREELQMIYKRVTRKA